ncbi:MAG: sulfatase [Deltaproteobacteria bacterium]|nr:sulfatase [Deltaproteobacteria bacterium]
MDASRTNVLWLTLCTMRADRLGVYGHPGGNSAHIDRLAAKGVVFERALTQAPWTRPAMGAMVTGVYPRSLDIEERDRELNDRQLDARFRTVAEFLRAAGYETFGVTANPNTNATFLFDRGFDHYRDTGKLWRDGYGKSKLSAEDVTALLTRWLRSRSTERPFFAHLVFVDTHSPYLAGVARRRLAQDSDDALPGDSYDLQVRYLDRVIGDLLETLDALSLQDTLVLITADHGEGLGDRGPEDRGHGRTLFNTRLAVPLILHHPTLPHRGLRLEAPVEVLDILPTVLDLLGLSWSDRQIEGRSLAPAIRTGNEPARRAEYVAETAFKGEDRSAISVGDWKLVLDHRRRLEDPSGGVQLYAIESDPGELRNLSKKHPAVVMRLQSALAAWQEKRNSRRPETTGRGKLEENEIEALRMLGYIEEAD